MVGLMRTEVQKPSLSTNLFRWQVHLSADRVNDHIASLGVICDQQVKSLAVVSFLDQDYYYMSVANQIFHGAGLVSLPDTDWKILFPQGWNQSCILW